jgi:hypothetical protein
MGDISTKLVYLNETKNLIKQAVVNTELKKTKNNRIGGKLNA